MPSLFFTGQLSFFVEGSLEQRNALQHAIKVNEYGLVFVYEVDDIPCTFTMFPFHIAKGCIKIDSLGDKYRVLFDGVAKIPLERSAVECLINGQTTLYISGVLAGRYQIYIDGDRNNQIISTFKLSKSAPKRLQTEDGFSRFLH